MYAFIIKLGDYAADPIQARGDMLGDGGERRAKSSVDCHTDHGLCHVRHSLFLAMVDHHHVGHGRRLRHRRGPSARRFIALGLVLGRRHRAARHRADRPAPRPLAVSAAA